jgi:hypothetical protein
MIDSSLFSRCPEGSLVIDTAVFKPAFRSFVGNAMVESFASEPRTTDLTEGFSF